MKPEVRYTLYHPKWYRRRLSVWWWLEKGSYTIFVLRELTSVCVGLAAVVTIWLAWAVAQGPEAYAQALARLGAPAFSLVNLAVLGALLFHALTWFHLAPKAMVVRLGGRRLPDGVVVALNYLAWVVVSAAAGWAMLRG
jgi:fumarate reductase subunit C